MLIILRCILVYHVQKKYKKRFFVNNNKYFLYLALVSLFSTCQNLVTKEEVTSKATNQSTPEPTQSTEKTQEVSTAQVIPQDQTPAPVKTKNGVINKIIAAPRCPYGSTPVKKMTLDQLNEVYEYTQKNKVDLHLLANVLERLISLSDNHASVKIYKLQYADAHFQMKHIELAAAYYEDFSTLYPGSPESEYALYKAVLCMFELSLDADRDQTNTKKTIALAQEFLKRSPKPEFKEEIETTLTTCYTRLYDHEVYVFNFYIRKKNFVSAQMRLDSIPKLFDKLIPDLDNKIAELAKQLELAKNPVKAINKISHLTKCLG